MEKWDHAEKSFNWHCLAMFEQSFNGAESFSLAKHFWDRTLEYSAIVRIKCGFNERKQLETMNAWGTLSPGGKQYYVHRLIALGLGLEIGRYPEKS